MKKKTELIFRRIPDNKCRRNEGNGESPLEQHSSNCCQQDPLMKAKIKGQIFKKKQDITSIASKNLSQNTYEHKGEREIFTAGKPDRHHLPQMIKANITRNGIYHILPDTMHSGGHITS